MTTYKESGVNIEAGDDFSKYIYKAIQSTWVDSGWRKMITPLDDFSGLRYVDISNLDNVVMGMNFDGIGTKVNIAEALGDFSTIGYDLVAMVCDDAIIRGAEPVLMGSIIDLNHIPLNYHSQLKDLIKGYVEAAKVANVQIINGEVAELGNRVQGSGPLNLNWGAGVVWFANKDRIISGKNIEVDDSVVLFKEDGFRSNGISLVRRIFVVEYGAFVTDREGYLEKMLTPSRIYTPAIIEMTGGVYGEIKVDIQGMANITGGGLPGKLGRMMKPSGLGIDLNDPFEPPDIMLEFQEKGDVKSKEAYRTWNMGNGFAVVTKDPDKVIELAKKHGIEAKIGGNVIDSKIIKIKDKGAFSKNKTLLFPLEE